MISRREKWANFDAMRAKWSSRPTPAPAFVQGVSEHSWCIQKLVIPPLRNFSRLYRLFNDPPSCDPSEPYYEGWPGDHRGWMHFPSKEEARDFYQFANRLISFDEYRAKSSEPYTGTQHYLDANGDFLSENEAATGKPEPKR